MASYGNSVSWPVIIGSISSCIAIVIFVTGRHSLAALLGFTNRVAAPIPQPGREEKGRLSKFLNNPFFLVIATLSSICGLVEAGKGLYTYLSGKEQVATHILPGDSKDLIKDSTGKKDTVYIPTKPKTKSIVTPLAGINIFKTDNTIDDYATQRITNILEARSGKALLPVIQGWLVTAPPEVRDSTETTTILSYKTSLRLKLYTPDGISPCGTRFFETTVTADKSTSTDKIKRQALAGICKEVDQQLEKLLLPCRAKQ